MSEYVYEQLEWAWVILRRVQQARQAGELPPKPIVLNQPQ